jgi:thiamine pyrophosphokinase
MADKAIVLANGEIGAAWLLRDRLAGWDEAPVIAADGGSAYAEPLGLHIDAVVGDLDSLAEGAGARLRAQGIDVERAPAAKDETDLELALLHAVERGATRIAVIGAMGGRLDMTLANILLLVHPMLADVRVELWHGEQTAWLIRPPGSDVTGQPGDTISLIPLGGDADGVSTHGLVYPLRDETLAFGPARGVSNVFEEAEARVDLRGGLLLAVHTPGRA